VPVNRGNWRKTPRNASNFQEDRDRGLIPFAVIATIGTTPTCGVDDVADIGKICKHEQLWLHVDAAYAGRACICDFKTIIYQIPVMRCSVNSRVTSARNDTVTFCDDVV
jgi:hypothetical protein